MKGEGRYGGLRDGRLRERWRVMRNGGRGRGKGESEEEWERVRVGEKYV